MENVDNDKDHDDPLPLQNVKLLSLINSSMLCKQSPKSDQAFCDTEERLDVSWIKDISAKQSTTKGETKVEATPVA